jgi:hypothetical protein
VATPDVLPGAVVAMRNDEVIAAAFRERYTLDIYERAIGRILGEDHPHLSLLAEIAPAIMLHRLSLSCEPLDADVLTDQVVALVQDLAAQ